MLRIVVLMLAMFLSIAYAGDITLVQNQRGGVELQWTLESLTVKEVGGYTVVEFPGGSGLYAIGRPNLPSQQTFLEIPANSTPVIRVEPVKVEKMVLGKPVVPSQEPPVDTVGAEKILPPTFNMDKEFYQSANVFPENVAEISYTGSMRGRNLALLRINPVQYIPQTGELVVYKQCKIFVDFVGGSREIAQTDGAMDDIAKGLVLNFQSAQLRSEGDVDYLIITVPALEANAKSFAEWKKQKGLKVQIEIVEPKSSVTVIKEKIRAYYPGLTYVLILGDHPLISLPTTSTRHPLGEERCRLLGQEDATVPSDLHYACLEGTDYYPDVYIGRVPANTAAEAEILLNKIINYQFKPATGEWLKRFLLCGEYQYQTSKPTVAERLFCETAFVIWNSLKNKYTFPTKTIGTGSAGIGLAEYNFRIAVDTTDPLKPGTYRSKIRDNQEPVVNCRMPKEWSENIVSDATAKANTLAFWREGCGIVQHRDHGGETLWGKPSLNANDVRALNNAPYMPILFSINCLTGAMDYSTDCFVEAALKNPNGGATAALGASRVSYSWWNDRLCDGIYTCMYGDEYDCFDVGVTIPSEHPYSKKLGVVLNFGKMYLAKNYPSNPWGTSSDYTEIEFYLFHCIGDPEMEIWTQALTEIETEITTSKMLFINNKEGRNLIRTNVCLYDGTQQIILRPNEFGCCQIPQDIKGKFILTITGENIYPYQKEIIFE